MVSLFKDRSPIAVVWLLFLSFIVHSNLIFSPIVVSSSIDNGMLSLFLSKYFLGLSSFFVALFYLLLILFQALFINTIFSNHHMYSRVNYLPAMVYILLSGIFQEWGNLSPSLLINTLVIALYAYTLKLYNNPNPKTLIFNMGLLVGLIILLYHPLALLIIAALFAVMIIRTFNPSEWIVLLLGIVTPFYFLFSYLFLFNKLSTYQVYLPHWHLNTPIIQHNYLFYTTIALLLIVLLIGTYYWRQENRKLLIQVRKNWGLLLSLFFVLLPVPFLNKGVVLDCFILWIVPASPLIAKGFFVPLQSRLPNIMFWALLLWGILVKWQIIQG